jgi:MarR family transcriptional regulator, temperature-dependent positive regulator of motility
VSFSLDNSIIHALHRATQAANDIFAKDQPAYGLTPRQLAVLVSIAENEGGNQRSVVDRTGIDRSTLAEVMRRLQRKGLLARRRTKDDARAYAVRLTGAGRALLQDAGEKALRTEERLVAALSSQDRQDLIRLLDVVAASASNVYASE